eukprot:TRINITY_DN53280_c0_g1_i1.p1 TRINITY_DN53280_c0_g1~~TRINITY_DN53280_c0_g1_i1.p1  ORF type:complete len:161 (-),score=17.20 TRINITY_DN53280_c0_g1_i1:115-597(-)
MAWVLVVAWSLLLPVWTGGVISRIGFGSCNKQWKYNPHWEHVEQWEPEIWIWTGDAIYLSSDQGDSLEVGAVERALLELQRHQPYLKATKSAHVLGVYDDHDYGMNDAGRHLNYRAESAKAYLGFLGVPVTSPRYHRAGLWHSQEFGNCLLYTSPSPRDS